MKILDAIFLHASCEPLKPAMALADRIVTYDMLARGVLSIEMRAMTAGIRAGQTVIVALGSPIRDMIVSLAMLRLGAVAVSMDEPDSPAGKQLRADWVLVEDFEDVSDVRNAHLVTDDWFYGFTGPLAAASPGYQFQDDEVCRIILSSGTTGVAKPLGFTPSILRDRVYTRIALNAECHAERTLMAPLMASQMGWVGALATLTTGGFCMFATTAENNAANGRRLQRHQPRRDCKPDTRSPRLQVTQCFYIAFASHVADRRRAYNGRAYSPAAT